MGWAHVWHRQPVFRLKMVDISRCLATSTHRGFLGQDSWPGPILNPFAKPNRQDKRGTTQDTNSFRSKTSIRGHCAKQRSAAARALQAHCQHETSLSAPKHPSASSISSPSSEGNIRELDKCPHQLVRRRKQVDVSASRYYEILLEATDSAGILGESQTTRNEWASPEASPSNRLPPWPELIHADPHLIVSRIPGIAGIYVSTTPR